MGGPPDRPNELAENHGRAGPEAIVAMPGVGVARPPPLREAPALGVAGDVGTAGGASVTNSIPGQGNAGDATTDPTNPLVQQGRISGNTNNQGMRRFQDIVVERSLRDSERGESVPTLQGVTQPVMSLNSAPLSDKLVNRLAELASLLANIMERVGTINKKINKMNNDPLMVDPSSEGTEWRHALNDLQKQQESLLSEAQPLHKALRQQNLWTPPVSARGRPAKQAPKPSRGPSDSFTTPAPRQMERQAPSVEVTRVRAPRPPMPNLNLGAAALTVPPQSVSQGSIFRRKAPLDGVGMFKGIQGNDNYTSALSFLEKYDAMADQEIAAMRGLRGCLSIWMGMHRPGGKTTGHC